MRVRKIGVLLAVLLTCGVTLPCAALAHKMLVSAVAEDGGGLRVEVFFPNGAPGQEVPVTVAPAAGGPALASGKTDSQGVARFPGVAPGSYRVVADDPLGHRAEIQMTLPGPGRATGPKAAPGPPPAKGLAPRGEPIPWAAVLGGLGFIFGLAAFIQVLHLKRELKKYASRD